MKVILYFEMVDYTADKKEDKIYMSIDHLEKGTYTLHILLNNEVVKIVKISKE